MGSEIQLLPGIRPDIGQRMRTRWNGMVLSLGVSTRWGENARERSGVNPRQVAEPSLTLMA